MLCCAQISGMPGLSIRLTTCSLGSKWWTLGITFFVVRWSWVQLHDYTNTSVRVMLDILLLPTLLSNLASRIAEMTQACLYNKWCKTLIVSWLSAIGVFLIEVWITLTCSTFFAIRQIFRVLLYHVQNHKGGRNNNVQRSRTFLRLSEVDQRVGCKLAG